MTTSESINELAAALAKAQGEMDGAKKGTTNPFFNHKYADLASVKDACREPFAKHGLSILQFPQTSYSGTPESYEWTAKRSGEVRYGVRVFCVVSVVTRLLHTSGQWVEDSVSAMLPNGDPQAVGSAITYLRRYALQAVAGIAAEDDDAEATTRGHGALAAPAPPIPPDGYDAFLARLGVAVAKGTDDLLATWKTSDDACRKHLTLVARKEWEAMKTAAAAVTAANKTVAA